MVAVNPGSLASHRKWAERMGFSFPVASDPDYEVCRQYGVLKENGKSVIRTVFIVDKRGIIRYARQGAPSAEELLGVLDDLGSSPP